MEKTVMIIDDDRRNIFALSAVLTARGYDVESYEHTEQALRNLQAKTPPGVILIDIMMPDIDGYEAIRIMKTDDRLKHTPVIAVTAQAMPGDRERCLEAGADEYVSKPVDIDKMTDLLKRYVK
jgi:two-component system cell cycle response regulator DivK